MTLKKADKLNLIKTDFTTAVCFNGYFRIFLRKIRCWMECFVIFVMAWCWFNATESKPQNVVCNIFSELTPKASLLFFRKTFSWNYYRKILRDIWKPNRTLSINFVLKLRFRENPLWNENLKLNVAWKYALRDNPNFAEKLCVEFFKFRKYYAAHNSGLKIWLVSGIFEMAQLFNLKFWLYLWRLGVAFSPHF